MPVPKLTDDGRTVTVDLHGLSVGEAVRVARRTAGEAARRGRSSVKLIHGSSTSSTLYANRSIKHELHALADSGELGTRLTGSFKTEDTLVVSLPVTGRVDQRPIRLSDVWS